MHGTSENSCLIKVYYVYNIMSNDNIEDVEIRKVQALTRAQFCNCTGETVCKRIRYWQAHSRENR